MDNPKVDPATVTTLLKQGQDKAFEVSGGKLNNFSEASPVTAILEANAIVTQQAIDAANAIADTIENERIDAFGVAKSEGDLSVGQIEVALDGLYSSSFFLSAGTRITIAGVEFETTASLTIPSFDSVGTTSIASIEPSAIANQPKTASISYVPIDRVATITLVDATKGGQDPETDEAFRDRVLNLLRRRDTLIAEGDFEEEMAQSLGSGSKVLAVGRLKDDGSYANGYVSVFGRNPDGSQLTDAQIAELGSEFNRKVAIAVVTVRNFDEFELTITADIKIDVRIDPTTHAAEADRVIRDWVDGLTPGELVLNKSLEFQLQKIAGTIEGALSVTLNGLGQPQALPTPWTIAIAKETIIVIISPTGSQQEFRFS